MIRAALAGLLASGVFALLALPPASASSPPAVLHTRVLTVHLSAKDEAGAGSRGSPVGGIALDGTHAAYVAGLPAGSCQLGERAYRWDLASGRKSLLSGARTCAIAQTGGSGLSDIALAGTHSAWLVSGGGNAESFELVLASTAVRGKDSVLATADRFWDGEDCATYAGRWAGGLVSDGSRIWFATWTTAANRGVTGSALWSVTGSRAKAVAHGSGAIVAASADGGHVALLRADGSVAVYDAAGTILSTIAGVAPVQCGVGADPGEGVALTGNLLAVLSEPAPARQAGSIEVYDRTTGELLHTWPSPGGYAWQFDAFDGIAVYVDGRSIHALDLQTGLDAVVATCARTIQQVRFDRAGLLYHYDLRWSKHLGHSAKLVFVPFRVVAAKLGR